MLLFLLAGITASSTIAAPTDSLRAITERFIAPCCWRENLAVHQSPDAEKMRAEIVQLVADGRTEDEIVEQYVSQYGERILRVPRGARFAVLTLGSNEWQSHALLRMSRPSSWPMSRPRHSILREERV
jgi:cytochrome c-type biogenesis protein CcmH